MHWDYIKAVSECKASGSIEKSKCGHSHNSSLFEELEEIPENLPKFYYDKSQGSVLYLQVTCQVYVVIMYTYKKSLLEFNLLQTRSVIENKNK